MKPYGGNLRFNVDHTLRRGSTDDGLRLNLDRRNRIERSKVSPRCPSGGGAAPRTGRGAAFTDPHEIGSELGQPRFLGGLQHLVDGLVTLEA